MSVLQAVRIVHETSSSMAECPQCGAHLSLEVAGVPWRVGCPSDVAERLVLRVGGLEREELHAVLLNAKNVVIEDAVVYVGNVSTALVRVGEVFAAAIRRCAPRIVVVHNHPSGDPAPSADDLRLTGELIAAGRLLDIEVLDHLIIGRTRYVSLRDQGIPFGRVNDPVGAVEPPSRR